MTKITRISTTLTARYTPVGGSTDAYWLDSRVPGARETRAADITLDREDRGFFFSVFAAPTVSKESAYDLEAVKPALDKMHMDVKHSQKNIDNLIVDFAECSSNVVGNKTINLEGVRHPFFAGVLVKEGEIAAITSGRGCAYLYRNDTLFPLTRDDLGFEAVDHHGKEVPNLEIYSAGSVGNVRYSNIANLQVDDCFILCNRELMAAIGQKEMLRILDEAYDQADAAGMAITAAASKLPNVSLQCMIGFVESVIEAGGKQASRARTAVPVHKFAGRPAQAETEYQEEKVRSESSRSDEIMVADSDDYDDDEYYDDEYEDTTLAKKVALTAVILVVTAACAFAIWWTVFRDRPGEPNNSSASGSVTESVESVSEISEEISASETSVVSEIASSQSSVSAAPTASPTSKPSGSILASHTIQPGELLSNIAKKYYGSGAMEYMKAIVDANKTKYPNFTVDFYNSGWVIDIPDID
ncbi:hypothetical protein EOM86_04435 [Candidatus Nomurabacteria bacterium]|nr:hypothetical protein [Candidatus Nomurabacteria bacterium]